MPFTIGLGRNSPVPLEGDPKKYEGLIVRHGQWVRWSSARKCSCMLSNNRPDPRCTKCKSLGWVYSFQEYENDMAVEAQIVDSNTIEMPYEVDESRVALIQDGAGVSYTLSAAFGKWIRVVGNPFSGRGLVYVTVTTSRVKSASGMIGVYAGHGIVQLDMVEYENPWARVPIDILSVAYVRKADGTDLYVQEFAVDKILLNTAVDEPDIGERLNVSVTYMPPYKIAVVNQNLSERDSRAVQEVGGDSLAIFPYAYRVAEQDVITAWAATQIRKKVLRKAVGDVDILPDLFVSKIINLEDLERVYVEGTHFVVWDRNTIRWIVDEPERPAEGKNYSIEYTASATYRVMQQFPNIRSSENKRFPSRVAIKLESGITGSDQV